MIGWHGTEKDFEAFDEAWLGSDPERSANGRLGVWLFLEEGNAPAFGSRVLEVEADIPEERILRLPNERMKRDHDLAKRSDDPHAYFDALRARIRTAGYQAIVVEEMDDSEKMAIVLDLGCISRVTEMAPAPRLG